MENFNKDYNNLKSLLNFYENEYEMYIPVEIKMFIFENILESTFLTDKADNIINNHKNVIIAYEEISYDGFNSDGPESDIWDLFIICKKVYNYMVFHYHWENWYCGHMEPYELYDSKNLTFKD